MSSNAISICARVIIGLEPAAVIYPDAMVTEVKRRTGANFSRRTIDRTLQAMSEAGHVRRVDKTRWIRTNPQPVAVQPELLKQQIATDTELLQSIARRLTNLEVCITRLIESERKTA